MELTDLVAPDNVFKEVNSADKTLMEKLSYLESAVALDNQFG